MRTYRLFVGSTVCPSAYLAHSESRLSDGRMSTINVGTLIHAGVLTVIDLFRSQTRDLGGCRSPTFRRRVVSFVFVIGASVFPRQDPQRLDPWRRRKRLFVVSESEHRPRTSKEWNEIAEVQKESSFHLYVTCTETRTVNRELDVQEKRFYLHCSADSWVDDSNTF